MIGFGGDGDSRLMKAMRVSVLLLTPAQDPLHGNQPNYSPCAVLPKSWNKWFCIVQKPVLFVQDTVHLAVKLKSRLLNPNVTLKMGPNCEAGAYHLVTLHTKFGKEEHFLRERYINHKDRQNFDAVMHIINAAHLLDRITGAAATKCSGGSRMGHLGQMPPPPPPSRNCIQDRDTLIEQSITLIKQSQCS